MMIRHSNEIFRANSDDYWLTARDNATTQHTRLTKTKPHFIMHLSKSQSINLVYFYVLQQTAITETTRNVGQCPT